MTSRFNDIASVYDAEIPSHVRLHLLKRKTERMSAHLGHLDPQQSVGLDLGCGTGWHVQRLQEMGFHVWGLDNALAQVQQATGRDTLCDGGCWCVSDVQSLPYADSSVDFAYAINVIHHLESRAQQMVAIREVHRVLKPGGLFFVHEVNTGNLVMRVYMDHVFPRLRRIDNGLENWIVPEDIGQWPGFELRSVERFTFVPDFTPRWAFPLLRGIEGWLERTPLRAYAAHYMAVLSRV